MNPTYKKIAERADEERNKPIVHKDHKPAKTRRDFLAQGFYSMFAYAALPPLLGSISERAFGLTCSSAEAGAAFAPYLHIELTGGASIAGNLVFGKQKDGAPLEFLGASSYVTLGLPPEQHPSKLAPFTGFGGPFHANSAMLAGLRSAMTDAAIARTAVVGGAGVSTDDVNKDPLNPIQLAVTALATKGELVQIVGTQGSATGGKTPALDIGQNPALTRATVNRTQDILGLIDPGLIATRLSKDDAARIAKAAQAMSNRKLAKFEEKDLPSKIKDLVECGYLGSSDLVTKFSAQSLDPRNDTAFAAPLYDFTKPDEERVATIAKMLLDGNAAASTIELGGYDYHGIGRVAQDAKDFTAGRTIGLALQSAFLKNKPMFIAVTSDGSVTTGGNGNPNAGAQGKLDFVADNSARGAFLMFAIGVTKKPEIITSQVGAFSDAGAVDTSYLVTPTAPRMQALNIAYNYAAFNGKLEKFNQSLSGLGAQNPFAGQDKQYLAFGKFG